MPLAAGARLGPYEILSPLGAGGMGEVYRARDPRLGREVAVKVLPEAVATDADRLARFERETRAVAAISHPNILALHDVGREGDVVYAVTELLEGETLREAASRGPLPWRRAAEVSAAVAEGLAAAHAKGIVHRDVKPENVFVTADGRVKILDFGVARREETPARDATSAPTAGPKTEPGLVLGTIAYLSPEQARGGAIDARSDIFALGALLYELLTGRRAFAADSASETLVEVLRDDPPDPEETGVSVPPELARVLRRCLRKQPAERFQSASDLAFALTALGREPRPASGPAAAGAVPAGAPGVAIAVLPFTNVSPDPENDYFSDGMTEELINALVQIPGLRVASRTSSFAFKDRRGDVRRIAEQLGVATVVEGSVRKAGDRLRIAAQLVDADGYQLWAESYDREVEDVFAIQEEIARRIAGRLKVRLGLSETELVRRATADPEAYNLYLKGRYFWNKRSDEGVRTALRHFEKAIAKDPRYALAYCGIADCYIARQSLAASPRESLERAKDAARKALELDDDLAEASVSFARATLYLDWDWPSAERGFRRARDENPGYTETYHAYSHFLIAMGRLEESRAASAQAIALDPRDVSMVAHLGWHYLQAGDFETSIRQTRQALEMDPLYYPSRIHLGMALEQTGAHAEAIAAFRQAADASQSADALAGLAHAVAASGRPKEARRTLEELRVRAATRYVSAFDFAVVHAGLGETDEAVRRLEEAAAQRLPQILELRTDPRLLALRDEPRIVALARRVGLPA